MEDVTITVTAAEGNVLHYRIVIGRNNGHSVMSGMCEIGEPIDLQDLIREAYDRGTGAIK